MFPVFINLGLFKVHPHFFWEALAYIAAALVLRYQKKQQETPFELMLWALAGTIIGAKIISWLEWPHVIIGQPTLLSTWLGGKSIAGALAGAWIAIEWGKKRMGIKDATGDRFVWPLLISIPIGRLGCFFTGLNDRTVGLPTSEIFTDTGIDFGDGIARHPIALYEIAFMLILALLFHVIRHRQLGAGYRFRLLMLAYFSFRLLIGFISPHGFTLFYLSAIQGLSLIMTIYCLFSLGKIKRSMPCP